MENEKIEVSYVMVKPKFADIEEVVEEVKNRFRQAGLSIVVEQRVHFDKAHAKAHYAEHTEKPFYGELEDYITSGPVYAMEVSGPNAISVIRSLVGSTKNPQPGTIRYDIPTAMLCQPLDITKNVIHASDSPESAKKEFENFYHLAGFTADEQ